MTAGIIIRNFDGTDDTVLAVDRCWTSDDRSSNNPGSKIYRGPTLVAIAAGDMGQVQRLFSRLDHDLPCAPAWFPVTYAEEEFDDVSVLLVFRTGGAFHVAGNGAYEPVDDECIEAIGSGADVIAGAFMRDELDPRNDVERLSFAFRAAAHWRNDVSPDFDMERITP